MGCGCKKAKKTTDKELNELIKKRLRNIITNNPRTTATLHTKKK